MPTVPSLNRSVGAKLTPTAAPAPASYRTTQQQYVTSRGVDADAFGLASAQSDIQTGRALGQAGDQFAALALQIQNDDNEREVKRLDTEFTSATQLLNYGDGKQERGFMGLNGEAAVTASAGVREKILKERQRIAQSASNSRVRELFDAQADRVQLNEFNAIGRKVLAEREVAAKIATQGRQAAATNVAINDPSRIEESKAIITAEQLQDNERQGILDPAAQAMMIQRAVAPMVEGVIKRQLAVEDDASAVATLARYGDSIPAAIKTELEAKLQGHVGLKQAQIVADQAYKLFPNDPVKGRDYVKNALSGKTRDAALERYNGDLSASWSAQSHALTLESAGRARRAEARENSEREGLREIAALRNQGVRYDEIPDSLISKLSPANQIAWREKEEIKARQRDRDAEHALDRQYTLAQRAEKEALDGARKVVSEAADKGEDLSKIDRDVWNRLLRTDQEAYQKTAADRIAGKTLVTDFARYSELGNMTPSQLRETSPAIERTRLADAEFSRYLSRYDAASAGRSDAADKESDKDVINRALAAAKLLEGPNKQNERGNAMAKIEEAFEEARKAKGNTPLTLKERREIASQVMSARLPGFLWGTSSTPAATMSPAELAKVKVPEEDKQAIQKRYRDAGRPAPTEEQIRSMYLNRLFKGK